MSHFQTICLTCATVQTNPAAFTCDHCHGPLGFRYDYSSVQWDDRFRNNMWRYWPLLPITDPAQIVTLGEGGTPLLRSHAFEGAQVYLKDETRNPTGSHKDRPLSLAVNHARSIGARTSFVVSAGSTGISNAALAARAGLQSVVIMSAGTPPKRVYSMFALGSTVLEVQGDIDALIDEVIRICHTQGLYLSSTSRGSNPYQAEANKTIAYEIVEELGDAPEWMVIPVGGGGTLAGVLRGFEDLQVLGKITRMPRLVGVLPQEYNALEVALARGLETWDEVLALPYHDLPPTILVKLAHGYPPDGMEALTAVRQTNGFFFSVTDEEALAAQQRCGHKEGLYVEPSTGACLAGLERLLASGHVAPTATVVALVSGSGFRENFVTMARRPLQKQTIAPANLATTLQALT
jgi:threonine synthase